MKYLLAIVAFMMILLSACTPEPEYKSYWDQERLKEAEWVLERCTFSYKGKNIWFGEPRDSVIKAIGEPSRKIGKFLLWDDLSVSASFSNNLLYAINFYFPRSAEMDKICDTVCPPGDFSEDINFRGMLVHRDNLKEVESDQYGRNRRNSKKFFSINDSTGFRSYMSWDFNGGFDDLGIEFSKHPQYTKNHRHAVAGLDSLCQEPHKHDPIQRKPISFWEGVEAIFQLPGAIWGVISLLWKD